MFCDLKGQTAYPISENMRQSAVVMKLLPESLEVPCIMMPVQFFIILTSVVVSVSRFRFP